MTAAFAKQRRKGFGV